MGWRKSLVGGVPDGAFVSIKEENDSVIMENAFVRAIWKYANSNVRS